MSISTKPYLVRALWQWCVDNGHTPYLAVWVNDRVQVPRQYVRDNEIVLNISPSATQGLDIGNDWISFSARFGGISQQIHVPVGNVVSIFARETGEGMGFELEDEQSEGLHALDEDGSDGHETGVPPPEPSGGGSRLRIVK
ncbi:ClpXP protease specificity-enhancing factor [Laribacter hongkongensis]|uniref:ClpXP protease specificity-enhancing factor n=1 Tax=Laribacter hongkongensis TaxID=168471 RepID=UPI001878CA0C|nr:ClpXP protease specificity-enhancing factor [Laribacter hongkongensis]MBE5529711.1 ClpXP protease specificity-enhancing factor [Laribacter hongkongensis]